MTTLPLRSATELATMLRRRDASSREVTEALLARIDELNPTVNAVVELRRDVALRGRFQVVVKADGGTVERLRPAYTALAEAAASRRPAAATRRSSGRPCSGAGSRAAGGATGSRCAAGKRSRSPPRAGRWAL